MELIDTFYKCTLERRTSINQEVQTNNIPIDIKEDEEMWGVYHRHSYTCDIKIFKKGKDEELYKLGYYKVTKIDKINIYEEISNIF